MKKETFWVAVTGLDGAGKTTLVKKLHSFWNSYAFKLPYHNFVHPAIKISGGGTPWSDPHTDRLIFATDLRLTNSYISSWRDKYKLLFSQRTWVDHFVFNKVQNISYEDSDKILKTEELNKPDFLIYLVADTKVAYSRIKDDVNKDKYEQIPFMQMQYKETLNIYNLIKNKADKSLFNFFNIPSLIIDTTNKSKEDVFQEVFIFLNPYIKHFSRNQKFHLSDKNSLPF